MCKNLIKLNINYKLQREVDVFFLLLKDSNIDDKKINSIFKKYPELEKYRKNTTIHRKNIDNFVINNYIKNKKIVDNCVEQVESRWKSSEKYFVELCRGVFKECDFSKYMYNACPSVWPLYVRDFKNKIITFPFDRGVDDALFVIVHELLHVIFYNYLNKEYPEIYNNEKNRNSIYNFSECLNVLIQGGEKWIDLYKIKPNPYPQHKELYLKMKNKWKNKQDIDMLINNFLLF